MAKNKLPPITQDDRAIMSRRIIPLADISAISDFSNVAASPSGLLTDTLTRPLRDLRISSVTDRCNFRCVYCNVVVCCAKSSTRIDKNYQFLPHSALLSFEESERLACSLRMASKKSA